MVVINHSLPPKEAGLLGGMILGDKSGFEKNFYENLKKTGVVHIVVVSGSNVILIANGLIENLAKFFKRKRVVVLSLILIWWYSFMVGWEPPVVRAVLLLTVFYWAQLLGRKFSWTRSLGLVVLIMFLADWKILGSVSFWLSLVAFVAVMMRKNEEQTRGSVRTQIKNDFLMTLWVSLWITPILAFYFGQISLVAPLVNAMVLLLTETITVVGGLGAVIGVFVPFFGKIILLLIFPLLKYFVFLIEGVGKFNWISVSAKFNLLIMIGWYMVLIYFLIRRRLLKNEN